MESRKYYGLGLPYVKPVPRTGLLIAIEGTDGVGRSTQIANLKAWLQVQGYGVVETGWSRSTLMAKSIEAAKAGNMLNPLTFSLLYATDFADRLEKEIIPALRAGFIVLADRYIYTAFARDVVRQADPAWVRSLFGFALVPDLICYLRIGVDDLVRRALESGGMNYWESGKDLNWKDDLYDSFRKYQSDLLKEFDRMTEEFGFQVVDAAKSVDKIQQQLQTLVEPLLPKAKRSRAAAARSAEAGRAAEGTRTAEPGTGRVTESARPAEGARAAEPAVARSAEVARPAEAARAAEPGTGRGGEARSAEPPAAATSAPTAAAGASAAGASVAGGKAAGGAKE